jgi:hypothetical protein
VAQLKCDEVKKGLRDSEALIVFSGIDQRKHYLRVERDFLSKIGDDWYLPIGIVDYEPKNNRVLVELSHEAETGINRLWVRPEQLDVVLEAYA